jgi:hypothetical protein
LIFFARSNALSSIVLSFGHVDTEIQGLRGKEAML